MQATPPLSLLRIIQGILTKLFYLSILYAIISVPTNCKSDSPEPMSDFGQTPLLQSIMNLILNLISHPLYSISYLSSSYPPSSSTNPSILAAGRESRTGSTVALVLASYGKQSVPLCGIPTLASLYRAYYGSFRKMLQWPAYP